MVSTPYFTEESVEKERGIIAQEIRMYEDSADSQVFERLFAAVFAHHPIRNSIAGTVESIGAITAQTLYDCFNTFYTPGNEVLCVVGDVDPEAIFRLAEARVAARTAGEITRHYGPAETLRPQTPLVETRMEVSMPTFALGFPTEAPAYGPESMEQEIVGVSGARWHTG